MADITKVRLGHMKATLNAVVLGYTKGGCEISIQPSTYEHKVDDYGDSPMKVTDIGMRFEIKLFIAEADLTHFSKLLTGATLNTGATKNDVGIGRKAGTELTSVPLILHPAELADANVDLDWNFHKVVPIGQPTIAYKIDEATIIEATFLALIDTGQAEGEKLVRIGTSN